MRVLAIRHLPNSFRRYFKVYTSRGIILGLGALIAVGISTTIVQVRSINDLKQLANQQQAVAGNTALLNDVLLAMVNAETGQRGYLLTGNAVYLAPYSSALPRISNDFAQFKHMSESQQDTVAINRLHATATAKLAELQSTLSAMNSGGFSSAVAIVQTNNGLMLMDSIRSQVAAIEQRQGNTLHLERAHVLHQIGVYQGVLVLVRLSALLLVLAGMYLIGRAIYQRYELERSKGEFIDIAAHQLRTPASVVKLNLGALLSGYMGKVSSGHAKAIRTAYDSNEHEIAIIEGVLKVAKIDNGDTVLHKEPKNVQKLLGDVIKSVRPVLKTRKQKLVQNIPKRPIYAALDPIYISMVVENLLDNASKYSHEKDTITVGLEQVGPKVIIHVTDTGVGIRKLDMPRLFKKFSRIENELSDSINGSGLGLYWSKRITAMHGGTITVKSKKGKGSTFTLTLPVLHHG
jgi:signal transduction histidine kinase